MIVATTAATGGVLLGAFVVLQLFGPSHPRSEGAAQVAVETKMAPKPQSETTGSAAAGDDEAGKVASADCEQQTWPHLSRACIEETRAKNRNARVISTDKIDKPAVAAIETPSPETKNDSSLPAPSPWAPTASSTTPPVVAPVIATGSPQPAPAAPAAMAVASPPAVEAPATEAQAAPQTAAASEAKDAGSANAAQEPRPAKKAKRKPRPEKVLVERDADGDDEVSAALVEREDRAGHRRVDRRRIVERDYDDEDGGRGQRVIVIRRGGGLFENLFGMGRRGDDD